MEDTVKRKKIAIIGGGSAGLYLAAFIDQTKYEVSIYEKSKTMGRKFLVAGKGGFNLSHSEEVNKMLQRYLPVGFLDASIKQFNNHYYQDWLKQIGIETFVGSSRRIFPVEGTKPIEVLNTILKLLKDRGVKQFNHWEWKGWNEKDNLVFTDDRVVDADLVVFALGGASWMVTGSDGSWLDIFRSKAVKCSDFEASNCAFAVDWSKHFINHYAGHPIKNINVSIGDVQSVGELLITEFGLEGSAIYALSPQLRKALSTQESANIVVDLKPSLSLDTVIDKIKHSKQRNMSLKLTEDLNLSRAQLALLKSYTTKDAFLDITVIAKHIKNLKLKITGMAPIDEAISTVGGVDISAVDENFQLMVMPNQYCIGEMLDWDAPTGGYLLQACFSMAAFLAAHLNSIEEA